MLYLIKRLGVKKWLSYNILCFILLLIFSLQLKKIPLGEFRLIAFDISVGDALYLETPEGNKIFIDGGIDNSIVNMLNNKFSFFSRTIDILILTHPDADHLNGALAILKSFNIKTIFLSGVIENKPGYLEFLNLAKKKNIAIIFPKKNIDFQIGSLKLNTIYPVTSFVGKQFKKLNDCSLVFLAEIFEKKILLTGDAEKNIEKEILLENTSFEANILKVGHHGSKSSTGREFIQAVNPDYSVISAGPENKFGHPHKEILDILKDTVVLITKINGDIEIVISKESVKINNEN